MIKNNNLLFYLQSFIRTEEDDMDPSWEQRLVKRYYDKLFKEYPLQADTILLSFFLIFKCGLLMLKMI